MISRTALFALACALLAVGCKRDVDPPGPRPPSAASTQPPAPLDPAHYFVPGPSGDFWCLSPTRIISTAFREKYFSNQGSELNESSRCMLRLKAGQTGNSRDVLVRCGSIAAMGPTDRARSPSKHERFDALIVAYADGVTAIHAAWMTDLPCEISAAVEAPSEVEAKKLARSMVEELLPYVTKENVSIPRANLLYVAIDDTGEAARKELERWPAKNAMLSKVAPLAPGYPKLARSDDYPDINLPKGKRFLALATCPMELVGHAERLLIGAFPYRVKEEDDASVRIATYDAPGEEIRCPLFPTSSDTNSTGTAVVYAKDFQIGLSLHEHDENRPGEVRAHVGLLLHEIATGNVLDSRVFELRVPEHDRDWVPDRDPSQDFWLKSCNAVVTTSDEPYFSFGCSYCIEKECWPEKYEGIRYSVSVEDRKLQVTESPWARVR